MAALTDLEVAGGQARREGPPRLGAAQLEEAAPQQRLVAERRAEATQEQDIHRRSPPGPVAGLRARIPNANSSSACAAATCDEARSKCVAMSAMLRCPSEAAKAATRASSENSLIACVRSNGSTTRSFWPVAVASGSLASAASGSLV